MKDRIPASGKGGRVSLAVESYTVSGNTLNLTASDGAVYGTLGHADNASQAGSVYNKASVLPTAVTSALNLTDASAEPKDAFLALNSKITSANSNISKLNNTVSGNYTQVATSDVSGGGNNTPDWRSTSTSKTDFLVSVTARTSNQRTLCIAVGSVIFVRSIPGGTTTTCKPRIWRNGNVWMCHWDDGSLAWSWVVAGETSIVIKAYLNTQSLANGNYIDSMSIYGR